MKKTRKLWMIKFKLINAILMTNNNKIIKLYKLIIIKV